MSSYFLSLSFNNIALLYVYAISLRFMLFDYKLSGMFWEYLISKLNEKIEASTKKTITTKTNLLIYNPKEKPNQYLLGLLEVINKLVRCPFCKGCWAGYILYSLFILNPENLVIDIKQVIDFALFSWSCGVVSLLASKYI